MDRERLGLILDRELRGALSVTPSPGFNARLRERVAKQPRPARMSWRWPVLAGAIAASIVVALGVLLTRPAPQKPETFARTARPPAPTPSPIESAKTTAPLPAKAPVFARRAQAAVPIEPPRGVEVIVPPGQAEAIQKFARKLNEMSVGSRQLLRVIEVFEGELPQVPSYDVKGNER